MTPSEGILSNKLPYTGTSHVIISNGSQLPICHVGQVSLPTFAKPLKLHNVLHDHALKYNLLSGPKLCRDNNCEVNFDSCSFYIKDKKIGTTLLRGSSR